ncbi:MAG TPA: WhiB family transcriptional regulator [Candidatus Stackebrandtia excrementipullorum]|nr:WhiB family transcriptional regulator [Candidatus Stackebrandtia excrementipullorum]
MDGQDFLADLLGHVPEWQERALCAQTDPEAFFPEKGGSTREAKRICTRCEVKPECLEFALAHDERFGIWGGLSERERRKVKREAREAARQAAAGVVIPMPTRVAAQENPTETADAVGRSDIDDNTDVANASHVHIAA